MMREALAKTQQERRPLEFPEPDEQPTFKPLG